MNHFSIRDIENLSGIKAHTLRIWEQRYQLLIPKRKESKHRYYDNEDLKHILRISHLYHNGVKISRIASLDQSMIRNLALEHTRSHLPAPLLVNQLIEASIDFD
ncbi:MAG: MerR family transcriptional regulator, partial [Chitinophagaceae bacterium]|nr:MerR family transcriptional regulator [Chitinophagaceae bacterium]